MKTSQIQQPVYIPACIGGSEPLNQALLKGVKGRGAAPPHGAEPAQASHQDERKRTDNDVFNILAIKRNS